LFGEYIHEERFMLTNILAFSHVLVMLKSLVALRHCAPSSILVSSVLLRGEKEAPKAEAIVMTIQQPLEAY
jgi:hypothetical protein